MLVLKRKQFSSLPEQRLYGKVWEGFKGAVKGGAKGALIGAALAPGKLKAIDKGNYKTAGIIAGTGALIGAGVGGSIGCKNAVNDWKYKNDPKYKEQQNKKTSKAILENSKKSRKENLSWSNDFNYTEWYKLSNELKKEKNIIVPNEILEYIKFYQNTWKKKINQWYDAMPNSGSWEFDYVEFMDAFPMPINEKIGRRWYYDSLADDCCDLYILTVNTAGDDGFILYDCKEKTYGWDDTGNIKTLKELLLNHVNGITKDENLSEKQMKLIQEFKQHVNRLK